MYFIFSEKVFHILKNILFFWRGKVLGTFNIFIYRMYIICVG